MPGGDGTGPMGAGPMTGRAAGYCAGYPVPGYMNPAVGGWGRGFGRGWGRGGGRGRGRGWGNMYYATGMPGFARAPYYGGSWVNPYVPDMTVSEEKQMLKDQADVIKQQLDDIQTRIDALEKAQAQESE